MKRLRGTLFSSCSPDSTYPFKNADVYPFSLSYMEQIELSQSLKHNLEIIMGCQMGKLLKVHKRTRRANVQDTVWNRIMNTLHLIFPERLCVTDNGQLHQSVWCLKSCLHTKTLLEVLHLNPRWAMCVGNGSEGGGKYGACNTKCSIKLKILHKSFTLCPN